MGVIPAHQGAGLGTRLVREGLRRLVPLGYRAVIVIGDPAYYLRFGFSPALAAPLASPYAGAHRQALELARGTAGSPTRPRSGRCRR